MYNKKETIYLIKHLFCILCIILIGFGLKAQNLRIGMPVHQLFPKTINDFKGMATDNYNRLYYIDGNKLFRFHDYFDEIYAHESSLESISVIDNKIHIGTSNEYGLIGLDSLANFCFVSKFNAVESSVSHISQSSYGTFILSKNTIYHFEQVAHKYTFPGIVDYVSDINGATIIHDDENGLSNFINGQFKIINNSNFLATEKVVGIVSPYVGEYIVATEKSGLFLFDGESFLPFAEQKLENEIIKGIEIVSHSENEYEIVVITGGNQLFSFDGMGLELFSKYYSSELLGIHYAANQKLYVATESGIDVLFYNFPFRRVDFTDDPVHGPISIFNNRLYWGSYDGLYYRSIMESNKLDDRIVKVKDSDGKVGKLDIVQNTLLMSHADGLYDILPKVGARFIPDEKFFNFTELRNGFLIAFGKRRNYLLELQNGKWRVRDIIQNLPIHPKSIVFDDKSNLWIVDRDYTLIRYYFNEELELEELSRKQHNNKIKIFSVDDQLILIKDHKAYEFDGNTFNIAGDLSLVLGEYIDLEQVANDRYGNVWYIENGKVVIFRSFIEKGKRKYKKLSIDYPFQEARYVYPYDKNNIFINNGDYFVQLDLEQYEKKNLNPQVIDRVYIIDKKGNTSNKFTLESGKGLSDIKVKTTDELHVTYLSDLKPDMKHSLSGESIIVPLESSQYIGPSSIFNEQDIHFETTDFNGRSKEVSLRVKASPPLVETTWFWILLGIINLIFWIGAFILGYHFRKKREFSVK